MIKNATIYRIVPKEGRLPFLRMTECLQDFQFVPTTGAQEKAVGWVEPRGYDHGMLAEEFGGNRILKLMIETRGVPGAQVRKAAQEAADKIEAETGRKPGKREMKELREGALQALLPTVFPRQSSVWIWIDFTTDLIVIGSVSQRQTDEAVTMLVRTFQNLALQLVQTRVTPQAAMTQWLATTDPEADWPDGFSVERECVLKSADESRATVRFKNHHLLTDEVRKHITEGKLPSRLAVSWESRIGFVLDEGMHLRGIQFLEGVFDGRDQVDADGFDADVAITTGELRKLIPALVTALGGEVETEAL